ncbi:MAG: uroporphyrinogen-III C-methyltransferase [Betaproteobacteria bacterium]|nr:uroporphyrinogen-III C-methyltransferase [Betaproteobacteria bacterium]
MGRVAFVGAGPGAVDLLTLRAARLLERADVVLYDALVGEELRELAPRAEWVDVGKRGFRASTAQDVICALLVRLGRRHRLVVRLKGGDPSVFGRLDEELRAVRDAGLDFEIVPGISAALAAAADTARPLTRRGRGRTVALCTAMTRDAATAGVEADEPRATARARHADTEVYYMAGRKLGVLARELLGAGWAPDTAVSVVSRAGCPDMLHSSHGLTELARASVLHAGRPTVVVVGVGAEAVAASPVRPRARRGLATTVAR